MAVGLVKFYGILLDRLVTIIALGDIEATLFGQVPAILECGLIPDVTLQAIDLNRLDNNLFLEGSALALFMHLLVCFGCKNNHTAAA
jgi:hypothetical protein